MIENQKVYSLGPTKTNKCLRLRSAFSFLASGTWGVLSACTLVMGTHKVLGTAGFLNLQRVVMGGGVQFSIS